MMRFRLYSFMLTFLLSLSFGWSQNSYHADSVIISLLEEQDFFELEGAYKKMGEDLSPIWKLFCEAELAKGFNEKDKYSALLIEFLKTYGDDIGAGFKDQIYAALFKNIMKTANDKHYQWVYKEFSQYIKNNPDSLDQATLAIYKESLHFIKEKHTRNLSYPEVKILRGKSNDGVPLLRESQPVVMAKLNNLSCTVIIDTGTPSYLTISKKRASGIKVSHYSKDTIWENNQKIEIGRGIIDSVEIGAMKLYNIPVEIQEISPFKDIPDSLKENKKFMKALEKQIELFESPIIGLPLLEKIGQVRFDFKRNKVSFPYSSDVKTKPPNHNLITFRNKIYTRVDINKNPTILGIDTGSDSFAILSNDFYQSNINSFSLAKQDTINKKKICAISIYGSEIREPSQYLKCPIIYFLGRKINEDNKQKIEIGEKGNFLTSSVYYDGILGYPFFRSMKNKTVLFDFKNMVVTINEPKNDKGETREVKMDDN